MNKTPNFAIVTVQFSVGERDFGRISALMDALDAEQYFDESEQDAIDRAWRDQLQWMGPEWMPVVFTTDAVLHEQWKDIQLELNESEGDIVELAAFRISPQRASELSKIPENAVKEWAQDALKRTILTFKDQMEVEFEYQIQRMMDEFREEE